MKNEPPFRSLRLRLAVPIILAALVAVGLVATASYVLGARRANEELQTRFDGIKNSLSDSRFPLNEKVLKLLAELTQTELIGLDEGGKIRYSTLALPGNRIENVPKNLRIQRFDTVDPRERTDRVFSVAVLFNQDQIDASRRRAAMLPLVTGLSTILALSSITLLLTSRLLGRIGRLKERVESVAGGDFQSTVSEDVGDELGSLGRAVDSMAAQLDQLWKSVHRQQSEKLLHQIAGGMAHQLRNSLTGARMAVELHASQCATSSDEGIRVAIHQIELSEDYVRRILLVASGRQDDDRPSDVLTCLKDVQSSLSPISQHLQVRIDWKIVDERNPSSNETNDNASVEPMKTIRDGPTWSAAVTNLIQNAMQAGDHVEVTLHLLASGQVRVRVADNGPGVPESIARELFEPFVTSKPEGMGLGLPLVKRAAERLGGEVRWRRENDKTIFELDMK